MRKNSEGFYALSEELQKLHDSKGQSYEAKEGQPYQNYRKLEKWVPAIVGSPHQAAAIYSLMRVEEKLARVRNLLAGNDDHDGESVEETMKDISICSAISLLLYRENKEHAKKSKV